MESQNKTPGASFDKRLFLWRRHMTKLPEKDLLSGSKTPRTTTGEMKSALGRLRDFLSELFGDDSSDKETARQTLGIDLSTLANRMEMETA